MTSSSGSSSDSQSPNFSVFYVILGGAALLSTIVFPVTFMFALRRYRRRSSSLGQGFLGTPSIIAGASPQQEEPELFDVYVKPGLQVREAKFEYLLPVAARIACKPHVPSATGALSEPPGALRTSYSSRSHDGEFDSAKAPVQPDAFQTYDIAVFIVMPHPYAMDNWNELPEYTIGTASLVSRDSSDDPTLC